MPDAVTHVPALLVLRSNTIVFGDEISRHIRPQQQVHVPMVAWLSPGLQERSGVNPACLRERAAQPVSHDNLFHSVLGLMDVQTRVRKDDLNLFAPCAHQATAVSASPAAPPARADHS